MHMRSTSGKYVTGSNVRLVMDRVRGVRNKVKFERPFSFKPFFTVLIVYLLGSERGSRIA